MLDKTTIRNAFTQAFFSLSLGIGIMVAYASYLDKRSPLPKEAVLISSLDTSVGILAGMVTFPILMSFPVAKDALGKTHVVVVSADPERVTAGGISGNNRCEDKVNSPIWNKAITTKTQPGHIEQRVPAAYTGTS